MVDIANSLLIANPQLVLSNGAYHDTESRIRETSLSLYLRTFAQEIINSSADLSLFSLELEESLTTDELRQAFSPAPYNFLLALELKPNIGRVLDLCQDFGGVSHYLATKASHVDSIKVDIGRAHLASQRCQQLENTTHISEDLNVLKFPGNNYDLIVLGNINELGLTQGELQACLKDLQNALSKDGCLVFISENKNRINKYLSKGSQAIPYQDLYQQQTPINLGFDTLKEVLNIADIKHANFLASFSTDHKISNLFAQDYLLNNPHVINHFNRIGAIENDDLNEYLLFKNGTKQHRLFDQASYYAVIAGSNLASVNDLCQNNFCHFPGTSRKAQWRTVTASKRGSYIVTKTPILNETQRFALLTQSNHKASLVQDLTNKKFHQGPLLLDRWLSAALVNDISALSSLIKEYAAWLKSIESQENFTDIAYDLLPFNIIIDEGNNDQLKFNIIDSEWQLKSKYGADFVLFRALFWFAFENKAILKPFSNATKLTSIGLFVCHFMNDIDNINELQSFVELEESIQRQISHNFRKKSVEFALNQRFNSDNLIAKSSQPTCQISWGNSEQAFDEANSVYLKWDKSKQSQLLNAELSSPDGKTVLRVDPIASTGLFNFSSITLLDKKQNIIWQQKTSDDILSNSVQKNVSLIDNKKQANSFIALSDDPHFLFDLSSIKKLVSVTTIEVDFALIHDENYDNALNTLSHIVNEQNLALAEHANGINEKLATIEELKAKLRDVKTHRTAIKSTLTVIKSTLHETQQASAIQAQQLSARIADLEQAFVIRLLVRVKRLVRRLLGKTN